MPLKSGDIWNLKEQPLSCLVLKRGLPELNLNSIYLMLARVDLSIREVHLTIRMSDHLGDGCLPTRSDDPVDPLEKVDKTGK